MGKRGLGNPNAGAVYVLSNEAMPGVVKIGRTRDTTVRLRQINGYLGDHPDLPAFVMEGFAWSSAYVKAEGKMHDFFWKQRLHPLKELFELSVEDALTGLGALVGPVEVPEPLWPYPSLKRSTRRGRYQGEGRAFQWMLRHYHGLHERVDAPGFQWGALSYEIEIEERARVGSDKFCPLAPHVVKQVWGRVQRAVFHGTPCGDAADNAKRQAQQTSGCAAAPGVGEQREGPVKAVEPLPVDERQLHGSQEGVRPVRPSLDREG